MKIKKKKENETRNENILMYAVKMKNMLEMTPWL